MDTKNLIECGTCGYPLTPEERGSLVEHGGRMVKPWVGLTDEEVEDLYFDQFSMSELYAFACAIESKLKEKNT